MSISLCSIPTAIVVDRRCSDPTRLNAGWAPKDIVMGGSVRRWLGRAAERRPAPQDRLPRRRNTQLGVSAVTLVWAL